MEEEKNTHRDNQKPIKLHSYLGYIMNIEEEETGEKKQQQQTLHS